MQPPTPLPISPGPHAVFSSVYNQHFFKGHVRRPDKDHVLALKEAEHGHVIREMRRRANPPDSWDSWTRGWVPPIRNQQSCGSCWLFSGTRTAMVALVKAGVLPNDGSKILCEQYFLDCGRSGGCGGDDNTTALEAIKTKGFPLASVYGPYEGQSDRCKWTSSMPLVQIANWGFASGGQGGGVGDPLDIQNAVITYGGVGCGVAADNAFSNYQSGTIFDKTTSESIDHDVTLTGYQVTSKRTMGGFGPALLAAKATVTATAGWWWMDNSWDVTWGEKGRMKIGWGINQIGSEPVFGYVDPIVMPIDWSQI